METVRPPRGVVADARERGDVSVVRKDDAMDEEDGVSFESGRRSGIVADGLRRVTPVFVVFAVLVRDTAECMLRAPDRIEEAEDMIDSRSPCGRWTERDAALLRIECMLAVSVSSRFVTRRMFLLDAALFVGPGTGAMSSSTGTSISEMEKV